MCNTILRYDVTMDSIELYEVVAKFYTLISAINSFEQGCGIAELIGHPSLMLATWV